MAYQMVDSAVETQIQQVALVDEDSQVSLENQRIEIPETGGKKKERQKRQKDKERQMFSEREKNIEDKEGQMGFGGKKRKDRKIKRNRCSVTEREKYRR